MTLPILVSVPHAGWRIPKEAVPYCRLTDEEIAADGDGGASEIYDIEDHVAAFVATNIARAIVDMNRAIDDRRPDGVVKTHTCWNVPVYHAFPPTGVIEQLLDLHYRPYHERLSAAWHGLRIGVDCHTMAQMGPPVGPDPGKERPWVCLSDGDSQTLPSGWMDVLAQCFSQAFGGLVAVNDPFKGGYISRAHSHEIPWIQLELSRAPFISNQEKQAKVLEALSSFCASL
ncbi:MAG: N-formylglutamate amidohydrolase [bacterium]